MERKSFNGILYQTGKKTLKPSFVCPKSVSRIPVQKKIRQYSINYETANTILKNDKVSKKPLNFNSSKVNRTTGTLKNFNENLLARRKQNYMNARVNQRASKVKQINKENKAIQKRINSQKSLYSSTDFNKSFEENCELKKRLSQSKLSSRQNSARSLSKSRQGTPRNQRFALKKEKNIQIRASEINKAEEVDIDTFKNLFGSENRHQNKVRKNSNTLNCRTKNEVYMKMLKFPRRESQQKSQKNEGGILHRIAEEMLEPKQKNSEKKKKIMRIPLPPKKAI